MTQPQRQPELVDVLPYAVIACTGDLTVRSWSQAAEQLYRWSAAEVTGRTVDELFLSGETDVAAVAVLRALTTGGRYAGSCLHRRRDGSTFTAHTVVTPVDESDPGAGSVLLAADVFAVMPTEAERRAQDLARFRSLVQNGTDLALICDDDIVIRYASPAVTRLYGYPTEALIGVSGWDFVHPDDATWMRPFWARAIGEPGTHGPIEFRALAADGTWRWTEEFLTNLLDDPVVQGIVVNLRDVTRQRQAAAALAASERRYRSIIQTAQEGVVVVDPAGRTVLANQKMAELLGIDLAELEAASMIDFVDPDAAEVLRNKLAERSAGLSGTYELLVRRRDGRDAWVSIAASPLYEDGHTYIGSLSMVSDITDRKQLELQLTHLSLHDPLTGLPNRALLADRLQRALDRQAHDGGVVGVLFCDVDNFKLVNDSHGHLVGDRLLVQVAERITSVLPATTTVARFGGDEFVVVIERVDDVAHASAIASVIIDSLSDPFELNGREIPITVSIGVAASPPADGTALLRDADAAMYLAKNRGRARVEVFTPALRDAATDRLHLTAELRGAAGRGELVLHYQPILHVATGRVVGVEALVRWEHPTRGMISPGQFIPLAEESGLIHEIDEWTLSEACRTVAQWRGDTDAADLQLMVNLSAREIGDPQLVARIRAALDESGLAPAALGIELTETAVMLDQAGTSTSLAGLVDLGVQIAIDDFGTGYSSLLYLKQFPVNKIKVDRTFVQGLGHDDDDRAIVASLVSLGSAVDAVVVAEGVETHEQLDVVGQLGCHLAQGYLWSPAVPGQAVPDLIERLNANPLFALHLTQPCGIGGATSPTTPAASLNRLPSADRHRVAAQILELHNAGASLQTIAAALNRAGWKSPRGTEWRATSVAHAVRELIAAAGGTTPGVAPQF